MGFGVFLVGFLGFFVWLVGRVFFWGGVGFFGLLLLLLFFGFGGYFLPYAMINIKS